MILSLITCLLLAAAGESVADGPPTREKKIYAHYMGCYPVAAAATAYHRSVDAHKVRHDGLPNWFEMYWFGKFLDYSTATAADANADPDGDGKTNIKEWRAQTDPTKPPTERRGGSTRRRTD